jgi:uncharacterized protein
LVEILRTAPKGASAIATPCIGVCTIEAKTGHCYGCKRTLKEVASWGRLSGEERERIMAELAGRRAAPA